MTEATDAVVRLFPDTIVEPNGDDDWIAMGREAAVAGETLILEIVQRDADAGEMRYRLPVRVIDSRPIFLDGTLLHRIRLHRGGPQAVLFEQQVRRG